MVVLCPSVNTICGRIMIGLSLLLSVSKHNMWSYYEWVVVFRQLCGRVMTGFIVVVFRQ